ncbi:hypothetical protein AMECASPLE_034980, partial [Ameca splendens]
MFSSVCSCSFSTSALSLPSLVSAVPHLLLITLICHASHPLFPLNIFFSGCVSWLVSSIVLPLGPFLCIMFPVPALLSDCVLRTSCKSLSLLKYCFTLPLCICVYLHLGSSVMFSLQLDTTKKNMTKETRPQDLAGYLTEEANCYQ